MSETITISDNAWVLVADGEGADLYSASIDGTSVALRRIEELNSEAMTDGGPSGQRPPEQTDQQQDEATFAKHVANVLYLKAHAGAFDSLVVMADPQTLGQLRGIFHQQVIDRIVSEIPKTFTNHTQDQIESALSGMMSP